MSRSTIRYALLVTIVVAAGIWAAAVNLPHAFSPGDVLTASALNENFTSLADAVTPLESFADTLVGNPCASGAAMNAVESNGTPICVDVGSGGGLTQVASNATLAGNGTAGNPLGVSVPLALFAGSTEALELNGSGTGIGNATLRSLNTNGGIPAWFDQTKTGSSDTTLGLRQAGTGPLLKAFGNNGGNEEIRITVDGSIYLLEPGAQTLGDFNILLNNGNGAITATAFNTSSDAELKSGFTPVDGAELLASLAQVPITRWHFRDAPDVHHIGPTAQQFRAAFGLGDDDRTIATVDADGIALAAIQALHAQNLELSARVTELEATLAALESDDGSR